MQKKIQEFVISALRIDPQCKTELRKVLKDEIYMFNKRCCITADKRIVLNTDYKSEYNVYGSKICINTIVGMNGSGKSSILEMIYRIINNFSSLLVRDTRRGAAYPLFFIDGLWASLYYVIDNGVKTQLACISCQGHDVSLDIDGEKVFPFYLHGAARTWSQSDIAEHWDKLFYTIVTNYSVQSFISTDFENEECFKIGGKGKAQLKEGNQWMSSLFNKNDGYLVPIVLNPYRDNKGNMNAEVERRLTTNRLLSILIFFKEHKIEFIEGYKLQDIRYECDINSVVDKYVGSVNEDLEDSIKLRVWGFSKVVKRQGTYAFEIIKRFGLQGLNYSNNLIERAAAYLVYKVLSVARNYPTYSSFEISKGPLLFDEQVSPQDKNRLLEMVDNIIKDRSHITLKIRQTRRFLQRYNPDKCGNVDLLGSFSFYEYQKALGDSVNAGGLTTIMEQIPPSFFVPTILFDKIEKGEALKQAVPITKMSSGERQFLYNFSTIIYHMRNLLSIQDSRRVRYRAIHLVFDEVEICFHPEYQRKFVNSLLSVLKKTRLITNCSVQITIATHSPFILSDVPQDNILYLEDGHDVSSRMTVNPFGANINDVLQQSFFLENGFVGEFAQNKINSLVNYLKTEINIDEWSPESAKYFIENVVGEPIIKSLLRELLTDKGWSYEKDFNY